MRPGGPRELSRVQGVGHGRGGAIRASRRRRARRGCDGVHRSPRHGGPSAEFLRRRRLPAVAGAHRGAARGSPAHPDSIGARGIVSVAVPNFGARQARRFKTNWFHLDVPRHRTHFTPAGLTTVLNEPDSPASRYPARDVPGGAPRLDPVSAHRTVPLPGRPRAAHRRGLVLALPLALLIDRGRLQGDVLEATARRPADS